MGIQIIGQNLDLAFDELKINASKVYESKEDEINGKIQVWELDNKEYEKFGLIEQDDWKQDYGWWRNGGTNYEGSEMFNFNVNGEIMLGFKNPHSWYHDKLELKDDPDLTPPNYQSFTHWFEEYMNLSKLENLSYFAHSLAKINRLSKSDFFKKYEG